MSRGSNLASGQAKGRSRIPVRRSIERKGLTKSDLLSFTGSQVGLHIMSALEFEMACIIVAANFCISYEIFASIACSYNLLILIKELHSHFFSTKSKDITITMKKREILWIKLL